MRWNLSVAALAASWGFISIIVDGVELSAQALVFYRLALAALAVLIAVAALRRNLRGRRDRREALLRYVGHRRLQESGRGVREGRARGACSG